MTTGMCLSHVEEYMHIVSWEKEHTKYEHEIIYSFLCDWGWKQVNNRHGV